MRRGLATSSAGQAGLREAAELKFAQNKWPGHFNKMAEMIDKALIWFLNASSR